ncbi:MAG: hypothetical protein HOO86_01890 [Bacteroidales bacterium]|nr:hypothetical protein [Bacteroidales bacterium]
MSLLAILFFALTVTWTNMNNGFWNLRLGVVKHDITVYYSYLPALFIYHDLSFKFIQDDPAYFRYKITVSKTKEGGYYPKMTMGLSFLYLPFFLLGYVGAWLIGTPIDGFSYPFMCCILFSSLFYAFIGLWYLRKTLLRYFDDKTTALTLFFISIGTNLLFYTTIEGAMSHAYSFGLVAIFIYLTIRWHEDQSWKHTIFIGLIYGLIVLIRPTNSLIVIFFVLFNVVNINDLRKKFSFFLPHYKKIILIGIAGLLVIFPQLLFWKMNTGHWIFYSYTKEGFFFLKPEIYRGLFSYRKGWFVYTPIMLFAIVGLYYLPKRLKYFALPIIIYIILFIYLIFSWWDWHYGGSFGARAMIDSYAVMAFPLSIIIEKVLNSKRVIQASALSLMVIFTAYNDFQILKFKYGSLHFSEMTKEAYWHSFFMIRPDTKFYDLLEPLDNKKLIKGEYGTLPKIRQTLAGEAYTGFEELSGSASTFISTNKHYEFNDAIFQNNIKARHGQYSLLLNGENNFGAMIEFQIRALEKYELTVWKYPMDAKAAIVFSSPDRKLVFQQQSEIQQIDSAGWGKMTFVAEVPEGRWGKYRAFLWNKTSDSVFFDDFSVKKLE